MTMMRSQNHRTNRNTAKTSVRKLRNVKPSDKKNIAVFSCLLGGSVARIARRLSIFCRLRYATDPCGRNSRAPPPARQRMHAFSGCVAGREVRRKLSRTAHDESAARSFDVGSPGLQLLHAMD